MEGEASTESIESHETKNEDCELDARKKDNDGKDMSKNEETK